MGKPGAHSASRAQRLSAKMERICRAAGLERTFYTSFPPVGKGVGGLVETGPPASANRCAPCAPCGSSFAQALRESTSRISSAPSARTTTSTPGTQVRPGVRRQDQDGAPPAGREDEDFVIIARSDTALLKKSFEREVIATHLPPLRAGISSSRVGALPDGRPAVFGFPGGGGGAEYSSGWPLRRSGGAQ